MASVDWSARPDQIEGLALREVSRFAPILEPFCSNAKTQVALINVVQGYCYEDTRVMKSFAQVLKVCLLSFLQNLLAHTILRFCIIKTVFPIRPSSTGTTKAPKPKVDSISSRPPRPWSR